MTTHQQPATYTPPLTAPTAWESIPKFIRFMTWVTAILAFASTIGAVIFALVSGLILSAL